MQIMIGLLLVVAILRLVWLIERVEKPLLIIKNQQTPEMWKVALEYMPTLLAIDEALRILEQAKKGTV